MTIARRARPAMREILSQIAQETAIVAKQLAPVDTGRLRESIAVMQEGDLKFTVVAGAPYAAYVEFGTANQSPQPYLTPAIELTRQHLLRELAALESRLR
jgi:HK97 gp10 family phage protein